MKIQNSQQYSEAKRKLAELREQFLLGKIKYQPVEDYEIAIENYEFHIEKNKENY